MHIKGTVAEDEAQEAQEAFALLAAWLSCRAAWGSAEGGDNTESFTPSLGSFPVLQKNNQLQ